VPLCAIGLVEAVAHESGFSLSIRTWPSLCFVGVTAFSNRFQCRLENPVRRVGEAGWDASGGNDGVPLRGCIRMGRVLKPAIYYHKDITESRMSWVQNGNEEWRRSRVAEPSNERHTGSISYATQCSVTGGRGERGVWPLVEWLNPGPTDSWSRTDSRVYVTARCARLRHRGRIGLSHSGLLPRRLVDPRTRVAGIVGGGRSTTGLRTCRTRG
jgi:hypothetical protein